MICNYYWSLIASDYAAEVNIPSPIIRAWVHITDGVWVGDPPYYMGIYNNGEEDIMDEMARGT